MSKIYQKMYLQNKCGSKSVLSGFTLIELLVVVLIIGILAAIALPQYEKTVERARAAEAMQMVASIARANEVYKLANGSYTTDISLLDIQVPGTDTTYNGWPRKETKLFQYGVKTDGTGYDSAIAVGTRLPFATEYAILALSDGRLLCHYYNAKNKEFCRSLGSGKTYNSSSYIIN